MTYAPAADVAGHGPYTRERVEWSLREGREVYPFRGRVGTPEFPAEPGRYHLYAAWTCPWAHRAAISRTLAGLDDVVGLSWVDDDRDARGWAFRERRGPDAANGFAHLSEAYEATEPGYRGHWSVPLLWDRAERRIVSNHFPEITLDLATAFEKWADPAVRLYPENLRAEIDAVNSRILAHVNEGVGAVAAARTKAEYDELRGRVVGEFDRLDALLADRPYLLGDEITEADVRLWVTLARFDLADNPRGGISERRLVDFPALWAYACRLHRLPAFRDTTDFSVYPAEPVPPGEFARLSVAPHRADWDS